MRVSQLLLLWLFFAATPLFSQYQIDGELRKWHKVTLTFDGPQASETGTPNPFTDYRLNVTFTKGGKTYVVPGYFAADGNASETGASSGDKWRVHFAPDETGVWNFQVSFRQGNNVALSDNSGAGGPLAMDGLTGSFTIADTDKSGRDHRGKGRLQYVGEHYLRFAETGEYFIKVGADAPENFLAYEDFDNTPDKGGRRKSWQPHVQDWNNGDPTWRNGKGKGIIGALNYLAGEGQNAFSFLTMNIGGDDKNVFPYISDNAGDRLRMDCSKLDQWEIVLEHADRLGMYLHFKTQETENDQLLDGGALGNERKLYYRELIARFAHHLALNWNIGEENTNTTAQRRAFAEYFYQHDPYRHHIVIHTYPGQHDEVYGQLTGNQSKYTGPSIQTGWSNVHKATKKWYDASAQAGKPWVVANDEQGNANTGVPHDAYTGSPSQDDIRNTVLWGNLLAGGAGVEYYFGYGLPHSDLTCQDFRSRDRMWDYNRYAHRFFTTYLNYWEMKNHNDLIGNNNNSNGQYCFAEPGETYVIYTDGDPVELDLESYGDGGGSSDSGAFQEQNGLLIIEAESESASGGWSKKTTNGVTFYEAAGNHFGNTNGGKINYRVSVSTPGVYRFQYKTNIVAGQSTTEHNDSWVKFPNNSDVHYFTFKGGLGSEQEGINAVNNGHSNLYYPAGSGRSPDFGKENPGRDGYFKVYRSGGGGFKWNARTIDNNGFPIYVYFKKAGTYTMTLSERSAGHKVDRIALYKIDRHGAGIPTDLLDSSRESPRTGGENSNGGSGSAGFNIQWYNPRTGGALQTGSLASVSGPGKVSLGAPPADPGKDWVILVTAGEIVCPEAGTPCDDGDPSTYDDVQDGNCNCTGTPCPPAGTACDDDNPDTVNDVEDGNCNCAGEPAFEQTYSLWLEMECGEVGDNWIKENSEEASDGAYLAPPGRTSHNTPPADPADLVTLSFELPVSSEYTLYFRTRTLSDSEDSFWVQLDGGDWIKWNKVNADGYSQNFQWSQLGVWTGGDSADPLTFQLDQGAHTLRIAWREPNALLDKVLITNFEARPVGIGMNAANACAPDCPPAGTACDDGNPDTVNDVEDGNCNCAGESVSDETFRLYLEAECGTVGSQWQRRSDPGASAGIFLRSPSRTSYNNPPDETADRIELNFETPGAGTYRIFFRSRTTNAGDDSYWVQVDDGDWIKWNKVNGEVFSDAFQWDQVGEWIGGDNVTPLTFQLSGGAHRLHIAWREPNVALDKVFITNSEATPAGIGDLAANACATDCPPAGTACDDGNSATIEDVADGNCNCSGTPLTEFWFEAECSDYGAEWSMIPHEDASNGYALKPPAGIARHKAPNTPADWVSFDFDIAVEGVYTFYARSRTRNENENSFWVRIDEGPWLRWNKVNQSNNGDFFQWDQVGDWRRGNYATPLTFELAPGSHIIRFAWREPGTLLDKLFITLDGNRPAGEGEPAESCLPAQTPSTPPSTSLPPRKEKLGELLAFPNPVRDVLQVEYRLSDEEVHQGELHLTDLFGRILRRISINNTIHERLEINLEALPAGTYYLILRSGTVQLEQKIIKGG